MTSGAENDLNCDADQQKGLFTPRCACEVHARDLGCGRSGAESPPSPFPHQHSDFTPQAASFSSASIFPDSAAALAKASSPLLLLQLHVNVRGHRSSVLQRGRMWISSYGGDEVGNSRRALSLNASRGFVS